MRRTTRTLSVIALSLVLAGTACGGGDSSGSGLTDEEFCVKVAEMETLGSGETEADMAAAVAALDDLAAAAPTKELREALETLGPVMTEMAGLDENDPDAMNKAFEIMMDPKVMAAGELIEKYGSETCGLDDESTSDADTMPIDTMPTLGSNGGYIFDDMSASDVSDYVEANGADYFPNGYISSTSINGADDYSEVIMDFVDADTIDGVALCEVIAEGIGLSTADTAVRIVVQEDAVDIAVREVDSECAAV